MKSTSKKTARGAIWDMDGVIVDSGSYHFRAWQTVFARRGVPFSNADFMARFGQRNDTIIHSVLGEDISEDTIKEVARAKEETFRYLARDSLRPIPGAVELLQALRENGFRTALGSSAPPENIEFITEQLRIRECFDVIVSGHEVKEGKPSPEGFLLAAERLGVSPGRCVVFEDAIAGVEACRRAGMRCVAVTNSHPKESLAAADLVVASLVQVTVKDIVNLLANGTEES